MNLPLRERRLAPAEILRYRVHGDGPARLLLVHGLASRAEVWTDLLPLFPTERYTLYILDLLGSGESSKPRGADYSVPAQASRLLKFLEFEELSGVTVVGHSLGGTAALVAGMQDAGKTSPLISSLVVIGGPGFIQRLPLIASILRAPLAGSLFVRFPFREEWVRQGLLAAYDDPRLADRKHIDRYLPCYRDRDAKRALVDTCRRMIPPDSSAITDRYREIRLPVLLLWGSRDRIVPISQAERLAAVLPDARIAVVDGCGHNPQEEKPDETFRTIEAFLSGSL